MRNASIQAEPGPPRRRATRPGGSNPPPGARPPRHLPRTSSPCATAWSRNPGRPRSLPRLLCLSGFRRGPREELPCRVAVAGARARRLAREGRGPGQGFRQVRLFLPLSLRETGGGSVEGSPSRIGAHAQQGRPPALRPLRRRPARDDLGSSRRRRGLAKGFMSLRRGDMLRPRGLESRAGGGYGLLPDSELGLLSPAPEAAP